MTRHAGVVFTDKASAPGIELVARGLDLLRAFGLDLPGGDEFASHYSTTLGPVVLLAKFDSPQQAACSIVHECQHGIAFWRHPDALVWLYLTEREARANYEAAAYLAGAEARFALEGNVDDPAWVESVLRSSYALDAAGVALGTALYRQGCSAALSGAVLTPAGKLFAEWLATQPAQ